ncbi:hypothetical protein [Streptomyces sp. NBC_01198]|uniref:hypothetical protein n=1 Tax=Streptomyces sp. NBC_01198 TaxID=2903769 RepID=UPI002E1495CA|nr:hypothetical protein OG702_31940 [Streptomyces sp. NBC_01198]
MSKVRVVSTVTLALEVDVPPGYVVNERELASAISSKARMDAREHYSDFEGARLLDVKAATLAVFTP